MITNIDIDEDLVQQAMQVSGARTKREVVDRALREMVARAARPRVREIWGTADSDAYFPGYDPKTDPDEPAGKYRVEQGIATYKVAPVSEAAALPRPAEPPVKTESIRKTAAKAKPAPVPTPAAPAKSRRRK